MVKKHAEIYNSVQELENAVASGILEAPYVAYIVDDEGNKKMVFSNDTSLHPYEANIADEVMEILNHIREGEVYCTEDEYNRLITDGKGLVTNIDGTKSEVIFDLNKMYYIYEEDVPEVTPDEPEKPIKIEFVGDVLLENNYEPLEPIILSNIVTNVNLNNKTITAPVFGESNGEVIKGDSDSYTFWVKKGADLTIEGNGEVIAQEALYSMAVWANGGKVTIKGGTFINHGDGCDLIYASNGGKVYIYGGEFKATERSGNVEGTKNKFSALNIKDADRAISEIVVYGGKFYGFNPSDNVSETEHTNFVASGYESVEIETDVWEVRKIVNN